MILTKKLVVDVIIFDAHNPKKYAKCPEFPVTGTLGVLIKANLRNLVKAIG